MKERKEEGGKHKKEREGGRRGRGRTLFFINTKAQ